MTAMTNSFGSQGPLTVGDRQFTIFRLGSVEKAIPEVATLPFALKILLENLLRTEDGQNVRAEDIESLARWRPEARCSGRACWTGRRIRPRQRRG